MGKSMEEDYTETRLDHGLFLGLGFTPSPPPPPVRSSSILYSRIGWRKQLHREKKDQEKGGHKGCVSCMWGWGLEPNIPSTRFTLLPCMLLTALFAKQNFFTSQVKLCTVRGSITLWDAAEPIMWFQHMYYNTKKTLRTHLPQLLGIWCKFEAGLSPN